MFVEVIQPGSAAMEDPFGVCYSNGDGPADCISDGLTKEPYAD